MTRVKHGGLHYLLQGQLRSDSDAEAGSRTAGYQRYPWTDLAELFLNEVLTLEDLDDLEFDPNRTHDCVALPLATTNRWEGLQADNHASLGHVRALVYSSARKARASAPQPHAN